MTCSHSPKKILHGPLMKWFDDKPKAQTRFPFVTEFGGKRITVTGLHYSGRAYETNGYGLIPLTSVPVGVVQELPRAASESTPIEAQPTGAPSWVRRGAFKTRPLSQRETKLRANGTRLWLESLLVGGPRPAAEVYRLARAEGISRMGVRRAKKHFGVKSVKTGGMYRGFGVQWIWYFPVSN